MAWFRNIFRNTAMPTRINQALINQSVQGYPLPVLMGCGKLQQSLLWLDGFRSYTISGGTGGTKGLGGAKGGSEYDYTANVIAALCDGTSGIIGIRDVWSGGTWLTNGRTTESYTIGSGSQSYTPAYASRMVVDHGVYTEVAVSGSYTDLGASSATVLSGTVNAPLSAVPYVSGQTLQNGQYAVDPSTGTYYFSTADEGKTVVIGYSFNLKVNTQQIRAIIPDSLEITLGTNVTQGEGSFYKNLSVTYYSSGGGAPNNGVALTQIPTGSAPTVTGTYNVNGTLPAVYNFAEGDKGQEVLITYQIDVSKNILTNTPTSLGFLLLSGGLLQEVWSLLESTFPYAALGYSGKALLCYDPMDLGTGASVQQNTFEVLTADAWGGGIVDCNPVQCILQVLTHPVWGLGAGKVTFPTSAIDNGTGGTWGNGLTSGTLLSAMGALASDIMRAPRAGGLVIQASTAAEWFAANSFFISPVLDKQDTAASVMSRWLEAGQCAAFMSEGLLKLAPFGDTTTSGNGSTWTAPTEYAAVLTDDDFIVDGDGSTQDPVKLSCTPWMDSYNKTQISWTNRANQYAPEVTQEWDAAAINRYGELLEDPQDYDFITTLPAAQFAGSMRVKRLVYIRNTYQFKLGFKYEYLEPMDVVSVTTSSSWALAASNQNLGLVTKAVRIRKIVDNPDGTFDIEAEDFAHSLQAPDIFNKSTGQPVGAVDMLSDPGDTVPVILDAPLALKIYDGNELWVGAAGANTAWGGCNVLASMDGDTYQTIGTIKSAARLGTLGANFPAGTDPDTANSLIVDLQPGSQPLESVSNAAADQSVTRCYVDGEFIAYSTCTATGLDQYTMSSYIRRALLGSTAAAHATGAQFLRLDDAVFRYAYAPDWIGKTVYLKFQSFNVFGNSAQDESGLTVYQFTPKGIGYPAPPVVTIAQADTYAGAGSATASNGLTSTSNGLQSVSPVFVTVEWTWPANFPTPSSFRVVLFEGDDPTNTSTYIVPIASVGANATQYTFAVTPNSSMTDVNAAVEAVYA